MMCWQRTVMHHWVGSGRFVARSSFAVARVKLCKLGPEDAPITNVAQAHENGHGHRKLVGGAGYQLGLQYVGVLPRRAL